MVKIYNLSREEAAEAFRNGEVTVAVYGLGKMGLPLSTIFADCGAKVIGVDISKEVVDGINAGINHIKEEPGLNELVKKNVEAGRLSATTDAVDAAKRADVIVILVPTLIKDNTPNLAPVYAVAENIKLGLHRGDVVITECTMPPGSTESLIPILDKSGLLAGKDYGVGHCPERTMTGTAIRDITGMYPKIVGGIDDKTKDALSGIYSVVNKKGVLPVSSIKAAELVKVFEGVYRDVNIGLANELTGVCERFDASYMEVQKAANSQPYCHLHVPGGVGGHCIPYYPYFIMDQYTKLVRTAREVNEEVPARIVDMAEDALKDCGKTLKDSKVLVLGIAFRGGVKETIKSTSLEVIEELKKKKISVHAYDPLYTREETEKYGVPYSDAFSDYDCLILMADHKEFRDLDWKKLAANGKKALVDARQFFDPKEARGMGYSYSGIGFI